MRERAREGAQAEGRHRGRNRLPAERDLIPGPNPSQRLNQLSHPGTPTEDFSIEEVKWLKQYFTKINPMLVGRMDQKRKIQNTESTITLS